MMTRKSIPKKPSSKDLRSTETNLGWSNTVYNLRWILALGLVLVSFLAFFKGIGNVRQFSSNIDRLSTQETALTGTPRLFDSRPDIWFKVGDPALEVNQLIDDRFTGDSVLVVSFEEKSSPWGVFDPKALKTIDELSDAFSRIPGVRHVRSLTNSPWVHWGTIDDTDQGLLVEDFFDLRAPPLLPEDRTKRIAAILGTSRAGQLLGDKEIETHLSAEERERYRIGEPRFVNGIVDETGHVASVVVYLTRDRIDPERMKRVFDGQEDPRADAAPELVRIEGQVQAVKDILKICEGRSDYDFHIAGMPILSKHLPEVGKSDMRYVGLMFLIIAISLAIIFRSFIGAILPLLVVWASILGTLGVVLYHGDLLNNLTAIAPQMIAVIGIADAVHLVASYFVLRREHTDKRSLITAVLKKNFLPVSVTSITTVIGFLTLTVSAVDPIRKLGYTVAIGTTLAYALSLTLVPALLSLLSLPKTKSPRTERSSRTLNALARGVVDFALKRRLPLLLISVALIGFALVGLTKLDFTTALSQMLRQGDVVRDDLEWVNTRMGGTGDLDLVFTGARDDEDHETVTKRTRRIDALMIKKLQSETNSLSPEEQTELDGLVELSKAKGRSRIATNPQFLSEVQNFERRLREEAKDPESPLRFLTHFDSALTVLRKVHQVQNGGDAEQYRVPADSDIPAQARTTSLQFDELEETVRVQYPQTAANLIAQYYIQYENGAKPGENLASFVTSDRTGFRIRVRVVAGPSSQMAQAFARIQEISKEEFPMISGTRAAVNAGDALATMELGGRFYMVANMFQEFQRSLFMSLIFAVVLITFVIGLCFRSLRFAAISIIPNILPVMLPLGVMGQLGWKIDGPTVVAAAVAIGVCVDDTVHLLWQYQKEIRLCADPRVALTETVRKTGPALTSTTLVLIAGFLALTLSSFRPNLMTGFLGACMFALAWFADFVLVPALLSLKKN